MIAGLPPLWLAGAACAALMLVGLLLLRWDSARQRRLARLNAVVGPHARALPPRPVKGPWLPQAARQFLALTAGPLVGLRVDRLDDYPRRWWLAIIPLGALAWVMSWFLGILLAPWAIWLFPLVLALILRFYIGWLHERHRLTLFRQFPDALAMIVRAVRVGIPVTEAIHAVARDASPPTAREFQRIADRLTIGMPLNEALATTAARVGLPEYRFFATALALQAQTGGGLAETLENLAEVIRKRVALEARASALSSEAKASGMILGALPFLAGGALLLTSPDYLRVLFVEPQGQKILAAAAILLTLGGLVMRSMIRGALRS